MDRLDSNNKRAKHGSEETSPLLATNSQICRADEHPSQTTENTIPGSCDETEKPLDKGQIFLLCYLRLVEPIAFFTVFPYINKMIREIGGVQETDVGFWSGLIESLFSIAQMCFMIAWGTAADRFGRKPVMVIALIGILLATSIFALSQTILQMIIFRCLAGVFSGNIVTIRAMISENCTPKTQARAFSLFAFTGNLGIFIAPLIGGLFSEPAEQYPSVFGKFQFFKNYPYSLPSFVVSAISLIAVVLSVLFLRETLKRKTVAGSHAPAPMSIWEVLTYPDVALCLYIYGHTMFIAFAFASVKPLFLFTDVSIGGLGFSPLQISLFMGSSGCLQAVAVLFVFPPLHGKLGTKKILKACGLIWPVSFALWPIANHLLKRNQHVAFWILVVVNNIIGSGASVAFTAAQLIINDVSPSPSTLGTVNGIALTTVSGLRAVAPALFASIFATGARTQVFGGYLVWFALLLLVISYAFVARFLPEKANGTTKK